LQNADLKAFLRIRHARNFKPISKIRHLYPVESRRRQVGKGGIPQGRWEISNIFDTDGTDLAAIFS
jgi:hypothetical protein